MDKLIIAVVYISTKEFKYISKGFDLKRGKLQ